MYIYIQYIYIYIFIYLWFWVWLSANVLLLFLDPLSGRENHHHWMAFSRDTHCHQMYIYIYIYIYIYGGRKKFRINTPIHRKMGYKGCVRRVGIYGANCLGWIDSTSLYM